MSTSDGRPGYGEGRVAARTGLRGVTNRAVAKEAGVTQGLVAHHFGSRDALIRAALQQAFDRPTVRATLTPGPAEFDDLAADLPRRVREHGDDEAFQYELLLEARRRPDLRPTPALSTTRTSRTPGSYSRPPGSHPTPTSRASSSPRSTG